MPGRLVRYFTVVAEYGNVGRAGRGSLTAGEDRIVAVTRAGDRSTLAAAFQMPRSGTPVRGRRCRGRP